LANEKKEKKHLPGWLVFLAVFTLCCAAGWFLIDKGLLWFNMPSNNLYPVRGVDVSHYQGNIEWDQLYEQGITFAFIKATEGSGTVDECFDANWLNARAAGIAVGGYHFFSFDSPGSSQAENFCNIVPTAADALPPVIDLEYYRSGDLPPKAEVQENLRVMLERLRSEYGKRPIVYTTAACYEAYLKDSGFDCTLWVRSIYSVPGGVLADRWAFWQYNPRGRLDGYTGGTDLIDLNVYRGTSESFRQTFGLPAKP